MTFAPDVWNRFLNPKAIAVLGASEEGFQSQNVYANLRLSGFEGQIVPVNPRHSMVFGERCYSSLTDAPAVDSVMSLVPRQHVESVVNDAIEVGAAGVIVGASGFRETADAEWVDAEARISERAKSTGTLLFGPNCNGVISAPGHAAMSTSPYPWELELGGTALVMQSGGTASGAARFMSFYGQGVRYIFSIGNATTVGFGEALEFLGTDANVRSVVMLIEEFRDLSRVRSSMAALRANDVFVTAVQIGSSTLGRKAAMAHTGVMAHSSAVLSGVLNQLGIVEAGTIGDAVVGALVHEAFGGYRSDRAATVGLIGVSGGTGALATDLAANSGLSVPGLSEATVAEAQKNNIQLTNPLDVVGAMDDPQKFRQTVTHFLTDDSYDVAIYLPSLGMPPVDASAHRAAIDNVVAGAVDKGQHLILTQLLNNPVTAEQVGAYTRPGHVLVLPQAEETFRGLALWSRLRRKGLGAHGPGEASDDSPDGLPQSADVTMRFTERELKASLEQHGCVVPKSAYVSTQDYNGAPAALVSAAQSVGFPLVLKGSSRSIVHKARAGLVALDMKSQAQLCDAASMIWTHCVRTGVELDGFLLEAMEPPGRRDLIVSVLQDAFGDILMVNESTARGSAPGIFLLWPFTVDELEDAIQDAGWPDHIRADAIKGVADAAHAVYREHQMRLVELNPVRISTNGGAIVLDAVGL